MRASPPAENVTMNNHQSGVTPENFAKDPKLSAFFNLLSTNVDRQGRAFGSSMEGAFLLPR